LAVIAFFLYLYFFSKGVLSMSHEICVNNSQQFGLQRTLKDINSFPVYKEVSDLESSKISGGASRGDVIAICIKNSPEVTTPIVGPAIATGICSFGAFLHEIF
jgi:hypothetical protein